MVPNRTRLTNYYHGWFVRHRLRRDYNGCCQLFIQSPPREPNTGQSNARFLGNCLYPLANDVIINWQFHLRFTISRHYRCFPNWNSHADDFDQFL